MIAHDRVIVTTLVHVTAADAFDVFTRETDTWWRRGPRYRFGGAKPGVLRFEPGQGGRLLERFDDGEFVVGEVLAWEPGARLHFVWRIRNFAAGEKTEVEVRFEPEGDDKTRVTLEHRGWAALPADHPARHGLTGSAFTSMIGLWWGEILTTLRAHAES